MSAHLAIAYGRPPGRSQQQFTHTGALWWTQPDKFPFRAPDALFGAKSEAHVRQEAERIARAFGKFGEGFEMLPAVWARAARAHRKGDPDIWPEQRTATKKAWAEHSREMLQRFPIDGANHAAAELGLAWPASAAEVRRAFRKKALVAHPDRGGSASAFIRLKSAYEAALRAAEGMH